MTTAAPITKKLTRQDFVSGQEVRWCPGCGDYAILAQMQKVLPEIGVPKENIVFVSGIGCSSRFPYYMDTYGMHSIHGRAPTLATGLKAANPDLSVWVITGDGDALSIGGNHLIHALRRNIDLKIILFNNRVYGLTKGQYSPTSLPGYVSKSSPLGSVEQPLNPISVALSAEATFIARSVDVHTRHLQSILSAAANHKGTAFVEIFQNCLIFNDNAWDHVTDRKVKDDNILGLEHGQPMVFGKDQNMGLRMNGLTPEVVHLDGNVSESELIVHDVEAENPHLAFMLSRLGPPDFPTPLGIFRQVERPTYDGALMSQVEQAIANRGEGKLDQLFFNAETWVVEGDNISEGDTISDSIIGLDEAYFDQLDFDLQDPTAVEHGLETDPISELNPASPISATTDTSLAEAIAIMRMHNIGSLLIVDAEGRLAGVFTEKNIMNQVACVVEDLNAATVGEFMTERPTAVTPDDPIAHALHLMSFYTIRHLPLVDADNIPVGMISFRDVVEFIDRYFWAEG
jgi:2-oxoglutarate ferredoxin oxidoreductase subunit beta